MDELPCHDGRKFTWTKNMGSVEMSDLPNPFCVWAVSSTGRRTMGFKVRSHKTGRTLTFHFDHDERDGEGEVTCSVFLALEENNTIKVFND